MKKRIISFMAAAVFTLGTLGQMVFAVDVKSSTNTEPAKPIVIEMTLQDAIKYAGEHNSSIRDIRKTYEDFEGTYNDIKDETRTTQSKPNLTIDLDSYSDISAILSALGGTPTAGIYARTNNDTYSIYKGYALEDAKNTLDDFGKARDFVEQSIYYGIEKLAYDIELTKKNIQYYKNMKVKLEKDLTITQIMLKLNMVTSLQVNKAKNAVSQMDSTISLMNNALAIKSNALKSLLGMDRTTDLKIKLEEVNFKPSSEVNIEDIQKQALANRKDALAALHSLRGKEIDTLVYEYERNAIGADTYFDAIEAYKDEKNDYENTINDVKFDVQKVYSSLLDSESAYLNALETLTNVAEANRIDKLRYENGMISLVDLMLSNLVYEKAQNDLTEALYKNILANKRFAAAYTIGDFEN